MHLRVQFRMAYNLFKELKLQYLVALLNFKCVKDIFFKKTIWTTSITQPSGLTSCWYSQIELQSIF